MTRYPTGGSFLGGCLHQDWHDEYPDQDDVCRIVLDELDSCYLADAIGWRYRDWLTALSDRAAQSIGRRQVS